MPAPLLGHGKDAHAEWGQRYVGLWSQPQSRFAISRTTNGKATAGRHPSDPGFSPIRVSAAAWFTTAPSSLSMRASGGRRESPDACSSAPITVATDWRALRPDPERTLVASDRMGQIDVERTFRIELCRSYIHTISPPTR
jgi:hypothetical protein